MCFSRGKKYILLRKNFFSRDEEWEFDTREECEEIYKQVVGMVKLLDTPAPITYIMYEVKNGKKSEIKRWERKVYRKQ